MLKKYFNNIFKYSDLVWQFSVREIQARHKGSKLGSIWSIITPVLMLGLYFMVFGLIFQGKFGVLQNENFFDFAVALFLGLTQFNIIADTISSSPTLISNQPNFVKKVIFPLEILSISKIVSSFYFAFISITICIILMAFTKTGLTIHILELPVLLVPIALI
jgi:lipopolysaccharide transport system permease protein